MTHALHTKQQKRSGFTLVELMVVVGIFAVITTIILFRSADFNNVILLENLAYDVALSIREAQVYGLSVRETSPGSGQFDYAYGIHFDQAEPASYVLFVDIDENNSYGGPVEKVETFLVRRGFSLSRFCGMNGGVEICSDDDVSMTGLSIIFRRPDPDALIRGAGGSSYDTAEVYVASPNGNERKVIVRTTGQISIE